MPTVPFTKATACGNDFLIVEREAAPRNADLRKLTIEMCERNDGIGADGVEWISRPDSSAAHVVAALINSDGSAAEISGNGTRCVAAWYMSFPGTGSEPVLIETGAGIKECRLISRTGPRYDFEMAMGRAREIEDLTVAGQSGVAVDLGNPHFVLFVGSYHFDWQEQAARLQADTGAFPRGTNIEYVRVIDRHTVEARFYERGAGETRSSGTGSIASALAAIYSRLCDSPVTVSAPGGAQTVRSEDQVYLRGEARIICTGQYSISP
jgi:diaminopimelate epimerase